MTYEVLYMKSKSAYGYRRVISIKPVDFKWGVREKDGITFGIATLDLDSEQKLKIEARNLYCVNDAGDGLVDTPSKYLIPDIIPAPRKIPEPPAPPKK